MSLADLEEFKKYFDEKIESMFVKAREVAVKRHIKLKKDGNQEQYDHQVELLGRVERIEELVTAGRKDAALEKLAGAKVQIEERMKLIRLADSSAHGWHTVAEYKANVTADNSADERRINKAEAKAEAKRKRLFAERNVKRGRYDQSTSRYEPSTSRQQFFRAPRAATPRDICYGCGTAGHFRSACPEFRNSFQQKPEAKRPEGGKSEQ